MTMHTRAVGALLVASTLLAAVAARADFQAALGEYKAGHYDAARAQFLALAEVGDCSSQFNLGAMALAGQGNPRTAGAGSAGCRQRPATAASAWSATNWRDSPRN